jgi:transposase InsO family protein
LSDRGSQYASAEYQGQLRDAQMIFSMSRKGNCYDNAVVERMFRSLKDEGFTDHSPDTRAETTLGVINYLAMYNSQRLHSTLGYQSPKTFDAQAAEHNQGRPLVWTKPHSAREGQI